MAGMLQIITYLLCVYLVYKGFEILQIALMSPREDRNAGLAIGWLAVIVSVVAAVGFAAWIDSQAGRVAGRAERSVVPGLATPSRTDLPPLQVGPTKADAWTACQRLVKPEGFSLPPSMNEGRPRRGEELIVQKGGYFRITTYMLGEGRPAGIVCEVMWDDLRDRWTVVDKDMWIEK